MIMRFESLKIQIFLIKYNYIEIIYNFLKKIRVEISFSLKKYLIEHVFYKIKI